MPSILADETSTRRDATPKIVSHVKSMLHKKGGGNRESNITFMSNTNVQFKELKISVEHDRMITTRQI